jgi:hypothetical protein
MSPVDRPDPRHRVLGIALQLAAYPPVRKHEHAYEARVPWRLIIELREARQRRRRRLARGPLGAQEDRRLTR